MSVNNILSNSGLSMTGLASGLDTEAIVENMLKAEMAKVFKIEQEKTYTTWQLEAYRDVIGSLNDFSLGQFNLLDPSRNILSSSLSKTATVSGGSSSVNIITNGDSANGTYVINEIAQLASASSVSSASAIKGSIKSSIDQNTAPTLLVSGMSFYLRLDGAQEKISFTSDYADTAAMLAEISSQLDAKFGTDRVDVTIDPEGSLTFSAQNSTLQVLTDSDSPDTLTYLGFTSGDMNVMNLNATLENNLGITEDVQFEINGVTFSFTKDKTLGEMIKTVNDSAAGVRISYSSVTDRLTLETTKTGAGTGISITNAQGSLFGAAGLLKIDEGTVRNGRDAIIYLNDPGKTNPIYRSGNVFTIDEITYSLKSTYASETSFTISDNIDNALDKIKSFVGQYNTILGSIFSKITEKKYPEYKPLSDTQKESMSENEITAWEEKAKAGILRSDPLLYNLYTELRASFYTGISGADMSFFEIGITTNDYRNNGKLEIDESKLRAALENDMEGVTALFSRESSVTYSRSISAEDAAVRFSESGFAARVSDILKKNISVIRNDSGQKGLLIEKAGIPGDISDQNNLVRERIDSLEKARLQAVDKMRRQEDLYFTKFSRLEQAINRINSQSSWISSMMTNNSSG